MNDAPAPAPAPAGKRPPLRERLGHLIAEYGQIALVVYLAVSLLTIAGFAVAIGSGLRTSTATGTLAVIGAAWVAAKATIPLRILVVLGVTPIVGSLWRRRRGRSASSTSSAP